MKSLLAWCTQTLIFRSGLMSEVLRIERAPHFPNSLGLKSASTVSASTLRDSLRKIQGCHLGVKFRYAVKWEQYPQMQLLM